MVVKRGIIVGLSLIVALIGVLAACAAPSPTLTPTPTSTLTPTPAAQGPLAQVIAGAKKEGTVTTKLKTTITPKSVPRLRTEIKQMFGIDLDINFIGSGNFEKDIADVLMEYQAGATASCDIATFQSQVLWGFKAGALERVDWKPLLIEGTNPVVVMEHPLMRGAIVNYTGFMGLMYNPEKVPAAQVPSTLSELANPKWKGKVGIPTYTSIWARWAYILGREKTIADLRGIVRNKAIQGRYADEYNYYLLGESTLAFLTSSYMKEAQNKGMPAAWQHIDFADVQEFVVAVPTKAPHPNAAKLLAVYLASPAGAKFMLEEGAAGNLYYVGNYEHDLALQAKRQGVPEYSLVTYPGLLEFLITDEFQQWGKETDLVLKGG